MQTGSVFKHFIERPTKMKLLFIVMFILYGIIISSISYYISNYYQLQQTKAKLINTQEQSFEIRATNLEVKVNNFVNELKAIAESETFKEYIETKELSNYVTDIFSLATSNNAQLSQLRFIDKNGNEKIRFDRKELGEKPYKVDERNLQNKSSRYYFKELKNIENGKIWFSKLDLNIEHGKIQKPIVPTLRIGTPVYHNNEFDGVLIMNIFFKEIINQFTNSSLFYITIYDKDGDFIYHKHPDKNGVMTDYGWSKYLDKNFNLELHKNHRKEFLENEESKEYILNKSISNIIPNDDKLWVYYEPKVLAVEEFKNSERNYLFTVTIIALLLSVPLALIISVIPNILNNELFKTKKLLEQEMKVVDEYVYLSITDREGKILDVSKAYENLTGFSKNELIGKKHNVLRHSSTNEEIYKSLWQTILSKKVWTGELQNIKKNGKSFNAKVLIQPNLDEDGEIKSFTSYVQDITNQKRVEKISITDELTNLYNRREFNKLFTQYVSHAKRYNHQFSMIILDIDYFKQYNDIYGHPKGDEVLRKVANEIIKMCNRTTDLGFRIGGEEFALIISSDTEEETKKFAEALRKNIENLEIEHKGSKINKYLTVSLGLFFKKNIDNLDENTIYTICDKSLYYAKESGRNRVITAST